MNNIFIKKINEIRDKDFDNVYLLLNSKHKKLIDKRKDKKISLLGYYMLNEYIINNELDYKLSELKFNTNGKPYFDKTFYFNISNKDETSVLVVSDSKVGVDIEKIKKYNDTVLNLVCNDYEKNLILNSRNPNYDFCLLYTMKESYIKMMGRTLKEINTNKYLLCDTKYMILDEKYIITVCKKIL